MPFKTYTQGISEIYVNMTRTMGDIHHWAWKAGGAQARAGPRPPTRGPARRRGPGPVSATCR